MRPPGRGESFDSLLDTPDSPTEGRTPPLEVITLESSSPAAPGPDGRPMEVITLESSSPASPGPDGQPIFSPVPMEKAQDHENCPVEELLSPEAQNPRTPGMVRRHDLNEDNLFIYDESIKYFRAIKESYQDKVGNPELGKAIVVEEPDQRRTSLLELAGVIKDLFKDIEDDDTDQQ